MAILHVAQLGHPILRQVAEPVDPDLIGTPGLNRLLQDMIETMAEYGGVGLAAPQVHLPLRIVALELTPERGTEFWINPELEVLSDTTTRTFEGCLSVQGLRAAVERPDHLRVRFLDPEGRRRAYELKGFPAVVAQHECDHLDGILYVDKCDPRSMAFLSEYRRFRPPDEFEELEDGEEGEMGDLDDEDLEEIEAELDEGDDDMVIELDLEA